MTREEEKELEKIITKIINDVKWIFIKFAIIVIMGVFLVVKYCS